MNIEISVIIPTYNRQKSLDSCLDHLLNQTLDKNRYEIIIINDGGNDSIKQLVDTYRDKYPGMITYFKQPNQGPAAARNNGARKARGDILFFLDDDCLAEKYVLNNIIEEFDKFGKEVCIGGHALGGKQNIIGHTVNLFCCHQSKFFRYRYNPSFLSTCNLCIKKLLFLREDGFDPKLRSGEDNEFSYRLKSKGYKIIKSPRIIVCHQHGINTLGKLIRHAFSWGANTDLEIFRRYRGLLKNEKTIESKFLYPVCELSLSLPPSLSIPFSCSMILPMALIYTLYTCFKIGKFKKEIFALLPLVFIREFSWLCGTLVLLIKYWSVNTHRRRKGIKQILYYSLHKNATKTPPYLILFTTNNCNAKCLHCFYWKRVKEKTTEMTIEEYIKLSRELGFLEKISLTGGEPFLRNDLASIAEIFYKNNHVKTIGITSNGICSDKVVGGIETILRLCPKANLGVCLGVDGLGQAHDRARGVNNAFKQLMETCERLVLLRKANPRLNLSLNFTLTDRNTSEFLLFYEFAKNNLTNYWPFIFSVLLPRDFDKEALAGEPQAKDLNPPSLNEIEYIARKIQKDFRNGFFDINYFFQEAYFKHTLEIIRKKRQLIPCLAGNLYGVIDEMGNVYACEFLQAMGNLKYETFSEIWSSSKAISHRKEIKNGNCFCYSPYFQNLNLQYQLLNPTIFYKIIRGFRQ